MRTAALFAIAVSASSAPCAFARIGTPTLKDLVDESSTIVIGKPVVVLPSFTSPLFLAVVCLCLAIFTGRMLWRRGARSIPGIAGICLAVFVGGTFIATLISIPASFFLPQDIAVVRVSETLRGSPHRIVPVFFRTASMEDVSAISPSDEYLLFLRGGWPCQKVSWFDWSVWTRQGPAVQTIRREWIKAPPLDLSRVRQALKPEQGDDFSLDQ